MAKKGLLAVACGVLLATGLWAAEPQATAVVGTGVENRQPQGVGEEFPSQVGALFCFSEVKNYEGTLLHVWFHGEKEVARIELPVKGERFRTWSKKRIPASWTGPWRVEVQTAEGKVLAQAKFTVKD